MQFFLLKEELKNTKKYCLKSPHASEMCPANTEQIKDFNIFIKDFDGTDLEVYLIGIKNESIDLHFSGEFTNLKRINITGKTLNTKIVLKIDDPQCFYNISFSFINCSIHYPDEYLYVYGIMMRNSTFNFENENSTVKIDCQHADVDLLGIRRADFLNLPHLYISLSCFKPIEAKFNNIFPKTIHVFKVSDIVSILYLGEYIIFENKVRQQKLLIKSQTALNIDTIINETNCKSVSIAHTFVSKMVSNINLEINIHVPIDFLFLPSVWQGCSIKPVTIYQMNNTNYISECYFIHATFIISKSVTTNFNLLYPDTYIRRIETSSDVYIQAKNVVEIGTLTVKNILDFNVDQELKVGILNNQLNSNAFINAPTLYITKEIELLRGLIRTKFLELEKYVDIVIYFSKNKAGLIECESFVFNYSDIKNVFVCVNYTYSSSISVNRIVKSGIKFDYGIQNINYDLLVRSEKNEIVHNFLFGSNQITINSRSYDGNKLDISIFLAHDEEEASKVPENYKIIYPSDFINLDKMIDSNSVLVKVMSDFGPEFPIRFPNCSSLSIEGTSTNKIINIYVTELNINDIKLSRVSLHSLTLNDSLNCGILSLEDSNLENFSLVNVDLFTVFNSNFDNFELKTKHVLIPYRQLGISEVSASDTVINLQSRNINYSFNVDTQDVQISASQKQNDNIVYRAFSEKISNVNLYRNINEATCRLIYYGNVTVKSFMNFMNYDNILFNTENIPMNMKLNGVVTFNNNNSISVNKIIASTALELRAHKRTSLSINVLKLQDSSTISTKNLMLSTNTLIVNSTEKMEKSNITVNNNIIVGHYSYAYVNVNHPGNGKVVEVNVSYTLGYVPYAFLGNLTNGNIVVNMNNDGSSAQLFIDDYWDVLYFRVLCFTSLNMSNVKVNWVSNSWKFNGDDRDFDLTKYGECLAITRRKVDIIPPHVEESKTSFYIVVTAASILAVVLILIAGVIARKFINKNKLDKFISDNSELDSSLLNDNGIF